MKAKTLQRFFVRAAKGAKRAALLFYARFLPQRVDGRRESARKLCFLAAVIALIAGLWVVVGYYASSYSNRRENLDLRRMHSSAVSSSAPSKGNGILPGFASLLKQNPEVKGWITIPHTDIDYPVVQASDNEKYLTENFLQQKARDGSVFLDFRDNIKPLSQNLIIYAHNMKDDQMFSELDKYERNENNDCVAFYNSSPLITFNTLYSNIKWKIFAVFVTAADSDAYKGSLYYLDTSFSGSGDFDSFVDAVKKRSFIDTSVDVRPGDTLLTLSTCDYTFPRTPDGEYARLVVVARRVRPGESTAVAPAVKNPDVVFPDYYYKVWGEKAPQ